MIQKDKVLHIAAGLIIAVAVMNALNAYGAIVGVEGFFSALIAGLAKETVDELRYGGFDFFDLFATSLGGVLGTFAFGFFW